MFDPKNLQIAVALMKFSQNRVALEWNESWQAFVFPMTKTKIDAGLPPETAEHGAIRVAAELLLLPTRIVPGQTGKQMRKLQLSGSDREIKDYHFTVVPVEIHPDFANVMFSHRPVILVPVDKLATGEYQPLSPSVKPILESCIEWGWL